MKSAPKLDVPFVEARWKSEFNTIINNEEEKNFLIDQLLKSVTPYDIAVKYIDLYGKNNKEQILELTTNLFDSVNKAYSKQMRKWFKAQLHKEPCTED